MRVLGIDPGLMVTGWGVIDVAGNRLSHVANGQIKAGQGALDQRLLRVFDEVSSVIAAHGPCQGAIEQTFVNRDGAGTLKLGQARGVALLALARAGIAIGEYAPNAVKKTVVGVGHAAKEQVAHMVRYQLPGVQLAGPDAADALAIAICHAHQVGSAARLAAALAGASR